MAKDLERYPAGVSWTGAVLCTVAVSVEVMDLLSDRWETRQVPAPVRRVDERTIQYADVPATVIARYVHGNDPWVQTVDRAVYQKWVRELGCEPVTFLVLSAPQYTGFCEPLLIHLAWTIKFNLQDQNVLAWDFNQSCLFESDRIDWNHEVNVIMGREEPYGPNNPDPQFMSKEELDARYRASLAEYEASLRRNSKRKPFWRRLRRLENAHLALDG